MPNEFLKAELFVDLSIIKDLDKLVKEVRHNVLETGLDKPLKESLMNLKINLRSLVQDNIRTKEKINYEKLKQKGEDAQEVVDMAQSKSDLLKYLFGADITKSSNYSTVTDSGLVYGMPSRNIGGANRVEIRVEITQEDDAKSIYDKGLRYLQKAVFALPDEKGQLQFYIPTENVDFTQGEKFKCSISRGSHDNPVSGKSGKTPYERFERDKNRVRQDPDGNILTPYATISLKQDFVKDMKNPLNPNFINLNTIVDSILDGDTQTALTLINNLASVNTKVVKNLKSKVNDLHKQEVVVDKVGPYINLVRIINDMELKKEISDNQIIYSLTLERSDDSTPDLGEDKAMYNILGTSKSLYTLVKREIDNWITYNSDIWFKKFVDIAEKFLREFESKNSSFQGKI